MTSMDFPALLYLFVIIFSIYKYVFWAKATLPLVKMSLILLFIFEGFPSGLYLTKLRCI